MERYDPHDIIFISKAEDRKEAFISMLGNSNSYINRYWRDLESILNFIKFLDDNLHKYDKHYYHKITFLGKTFHDLIFSDLSSMLVLIYYKQKYQMNIILRHFIETFIFSLFADICSNFNDTFNFLLRKEWKEKREELRLLWDSDSKDKNRNIEKRLKKIQFLNNYNHKRDFEKYYFTKANKNDLEILFSLPCCNKCYDKKKNGNGLRFFSYDTNLVDKRRYKFISDINLTCSFCGDITKITRYTQGLLNFNDAMTILNKILEPKYIKNIRAMKEMYKHLSSDFVHFSTTISPLRTNNFRINSQNGITNIWRIDSLTFVLKQLTPLLEFYFKKIRQSAN